MRAKPMVATCLLCLLFVLSGVVLVQADSEAYVIQSRQASSPSPLVSESAVPVSDFLEDDVRESVTADAALCRFGFGLALQSLDCYDPNELAKLRADIYMNWGASSNPPTPNAMEYVQTVRVKQWKWKDGQLVYADYAAPYAVPYTYTLSLRGSRLADVAVAEPGSLWLIGNEIERRDWQASGGGTLSQDEILPEVYARAYHEAYTTIKAVDPTARVAIGGLIQATPLRLKYLDRVWNEYIRLYGHSIPVDWWNIHAFILQEKRNDWGADIPAGLAETEGVLYTPDDNKDWTKAVPLIHAFRQWMKAHGEQQKPLIVSEYGVNMPWFTAEDVRDDFMIPSFEFFLNTRDPSLGYAPDDYRLVQKWMWYSLDDDADAYNGALFYSGLNGIDTGLTTLGTYWTNYVDQVMITDTVNLIPTGLSYVSGFSVGHPVTVTAIFRVSNSGHGTLNRPFSIEVLGDGGPIATKDVSELPGCGDTSELNFLWPDLEPGVHTVTIRVDSMGAISETNESDNVLTGMILVPTHQVFLPTVARGR